MIEGFRFMPEYFSAAAQKALVGEVLAMLDANPLFRATMPRTGKPMSVRMTNLGPLGWISDISGYRYGELHPATGKPWADIPKTLLELWDDVSDYPAPPQACLVNWYEASSRLGLHIDADETARDAPVVSVSLGSRALFRLGGEKIRHRRCGWRQAMSSCSAADRAAPITASIASIRTTRRWFPAAGGSTSRCAA